MRSPPPPAARLSGTYNDFLTLPDVEDVARPLAADAFDWSGEDLPGGRMVRYFQPASDLHDSVTGYHVYSSLGPDRFDELHWFLPGTTNIRIAVDAGPVHVQIGRRHFDVPAVSVFGPTTRALQVITNGGHMAGVGISALGWSRLRLGAANKVTDRIVSLADVAGAEVTARVRDAVAASGVEDALPGALDELFRGLLGPPGEDDAAIRRLMKLSVANQHTDIALAAADAGMSQHSLRRISMRYFGMPPKLLLTRARFLRSYLAVIGGGRADYGRIDPSYTDVPHFLRDAKRFLGMTARRFEAMDTPFLDASLRMHAAVLGAATQVLNEID